MNSPYFKEKLNYNTISQVLISIISSYLSVKCIMPCLKLGSSDYVYDKNYYEAKSNTDTTHISTILPSDITIPLIVGDNNQSSCRRQPDLTFRSTLSPHFSPIFPNYPSNHIIISANESNLIHFKNGGTYYILPKIDSLKWTNEPDINIQSIIINLLLKDNNIYDTPIIYATSDIAINFIDSSNNIVNNPSFIYKNNNIVPFPLKPGSNLSLTIQFQVVLSTPPTIPGNIISFTLNKFQLDLIKVLHP